jgi:sugar lactone lactonase YvrE
VSCEDDVQKEIVISVSTLAGGVSGDVDGHATAARLRNPGQIVMGNDGTLYFTDSHNHKIKGVTPSGDVFTVAGSVKGWEDGDASSARFNYPCGIALAADGTLYVSDSTRIRKITPSGIVSTLAGNAIAGNSDGIGGAASFNSPAGITLDYEGNLYVADMGNSLIRKITPSGAVTTIAGSGHGYQDGEGSAVQFNHPAGIEFGPDTALYVADTRNYNIRRVTMSGEVTTVIGQEILDELSGNSSLITPMDVTLDAIGNLVIADSRGRVMMANALGKISVIAGLDNGYVDGHSSNARFSLIMGIALGRDGSIYVCDSGNHAIREISFE